MRTSGSLALLLLAGVGVWQFATLRPGHDWGDDFALYVRHAQNLAEGRAYGDTGYIYNPFFPQLSPRTYPPVFPLLLASVYRLCGLDLTAMKVVVILLFLTFLAVFYRVCRRELPAPFALATLLLLGFNPFLWDHKDRLLSEIPFLLWTTLCLWLSNRARTSATPRRAVWLAALAGVCAYLAYGTRTAGIVLPVSVAAYDLLRLRLTSRVSLVTLAAFAAGAAVQRLLLPPDGSYLDQLVFDPPFFAENFVSLAKAMSLFVGNGYLALPRLVLFAVLLALALAGYVGRVRQEFGVREVFGPLYLALVTVWPSSAWDRRFLLPLLPLFVVYVCHGLRMFGAVDARRLTPSAGVALSLAVLASYAGQYTRAEWGRHREGVAKPESVAFFDYVKAATAPEDVFVFQKPRALALFTGRRASGHHTPRSDADLLEYLDRIQARYVVVCRALADSEALLKPFVERNADQFEEAFRNADFVVYRVVDAPRYPGVGRARRGPAGEG